MFQDTFSYISERFELNFWCICNLGISLLLNDSYLIYFLNFLNPASYLSRLSFKETILSDKFLNLLKGFSFGEIPDNLTVFGT